MRRCLIGTCQIRVYGICDCAQADAEAREQDACPPCADGEHATCEDGHCTCCGVLAEPDEPDPDDDPDERLAWGGLDIPS